MRLGGLILRQALEGIGGIATETIAEDFHTTIRLHGQGWHTRYHDETLVQGLAPHDLATYLLQRDRWARGNLAVLRTPENPASRPASPSNSGPATSRPCWPISSPCSAWPCWPSWWRCWSVAGFPLHATLWQFALFWLPWMALNLTALGHALSGTGQAVGRRLLHLLTTGIFARAAFVLCTRSGPCSR